MHLTQEYGREAIPHPEPSNVFSVLIVVNRVSVAIVIREYLRMIGGEGWTILELYHLDDALKHLRGHYVDVLILDEDLMSTEVVPGLFSARVAELVPSRGVIILTSLKEFRGSSSMMKKLGTDRVLYKPFDLESLGKMCLERAAEKIPSR